MPRTAKTTKARVKSGSNHAGNNAKTRDDSTIPSPSDFQELSREDQLLKVAEANLKTYGSIEPPREVIMWAQKHTCTRCGRQGDVSLFGMKNDKRNGKTYIQNWCRQCRSSNASHPTRFGRPPRAKPVPRFKTAMLKAMTVAQRARYEALYAEIAPAGQE